MRVGEDGLVEYFERQTDQGLFDRLSKLYQARVVQNMKEEGDGPVALWTRAETESTSGSRAAADNQMVISTEAAEAEAVPAMESAGAADSYTAVSAEAAET